MIFNFRASNGIGIIKLNKGGTGFQGADSAISKFGLDAPKTEALREFFQHERDEELERWRWPENPDYVVYPRNDGAVLVFFERIAEGGILYRRGDPAHDMEGEAARAYFATHPIDSWKNAKPGEVWELTIDGEATIAFAYAHPRSEFSSFQTALRSVFGPGASAITAGHRVWPEEEK